MAKTRNKAHDENERLSAAAWKLAQGGWEKVTVEAVARKAGFAPEKIKARFHAPHKLIPLLVRDITQQALARADHPSGSSRDILFDLLMTRFDVLQQHRKAVLSMTHAAKRDPAASASLSCAILEAMMATADAADLDFPPRPLLAAALSAIYGFAFLAWRKDTTSDMSKTMAALDRGLRLAGRASSLVRRNH